MHNIDIQDNLTLNRLIKPENWMKNHVTLCTLFIKVDNNKNGRGKKKMAF